MWRTVIKNEGLIPERFHDQPDFIRALVVATRYAGHTSLAACEKIMALFSSEELVDMSTAHGVMEYMFASLQETKTGFSLKNLVTPEKLFEKLDACSIDVSIDILDQFSELAIMTSQRYILFGVVRKLTVEQLQKLPKTFLEVFLSQSMGLLQNYPGVLKDVYRYMIEDNYTDAVHAILSVFDTEEVYNILRGVKVDMIANIIDLVL